MTVHLFPQYTSSPINKRILFSCHCHHHYYCYCQLKMQYYGYGYTQLGIMHLQFATVIAADWWAHSYSSELHHIYCLKISYGYVWQLLCSCRCEFYHYNYCCELPCHQNDLLIQLQIAMTEWQCEQWKWSKSYYSLLYFIWSQNINVSHFFKYLLSNTMETYSDATAASYKFHSYKFCCHKFYGCVGTSFIWLRIWVPLQ